MRGVPVGDGKHCGTVSINGDGHENVARNEIAKDPEEDHHLAGDPVCPPGYCGSPGNLQWNSNQNYLNKSMLELDKNRNFKIQSSIV